MAYRMHPRQRANILDFRSEASTRSNLNTRRTKAAARIQAAFRGYKQRKLLKEKEPKKYHILVQISKKIRRQFKNSGKKMALNMFTPSKNKVAEKKM